MAGDGRHCELGQGYESLTTREIRAPVTVLMIPAHFPSDTKESPEIADQPPDWQTVYAPATELQAASAEVVKLPV